MLYFFYNVNIRLLRGKALGRLLYKFVVNPLFVVDMVNAVCLWGIFRIVQCNFFFQLSLIVNSFNS